MSKSRLMFVVGAMMALIAYGWPGAVGADTGGLTGKVMGWTCFTTGKGCAVDPDDPVVQMESNFVLVTGPDSYYLLDNVDRSTLARYVTRTVTVDGPVNERYRAVTVERIQADGRTVWSLAEQRKRQERYERSRENDPVNFNLYGGGR